MRHHSHVPCCRHHAAASSSDLSSAPTTLDGLVEALGVDLAAFMWIGVVLALRWAETAGLSVDRLDILGGKLMIDRQLARSGQLQPRSPRLANQRSNAVHGCSTSSL